MGEWRPSSWGEEISLEYGKSLRGYENTAGQYRVFGSNGPIGWTDEFLARGPGVILGRKGAYRGVHFSPAPFFVIDTAYYVVPKTELDMRWLYYAIKHYKLGEIDDGSPIPSTTRAAVYIQELEVPPLDEQHTIAHILGTLDDKIELNRRMNETLEAMARALFKSWFVDFEPVRAKVEGRDTGLPKEIADLFPDSFEDSELGEVPKGWRAVTLGDIACNISRPFNFNQITDVVFINTGDVLEGEFLNSKRSSHIGLPGQAKKAIQSDDILFSEIRPANKRYAYVDFSASDYVVSTKFMVIKASDEILPRLLYRILISDETLSEFQVQAESRSGTFPQITFDSINYLPIVLPTMRIQEAFQRTVRDIDARIKLNNQESSTLVTQRDALLPKLLSGEIRVTSEKGNPS